jgi:hypothetical protein
MTIPKTLAALPSNQYATVLSLVLGNDRVDLVLASIIGVANGVDLWDSVCEVWCRNAWKKVGEMRELCGVLWIMARQVKNCWDSCGVALRRVAKPRRTEAIPIGLLMNYRDFEEVWNSSWTKSIIGAEFQTFK